MSDDFQVTGTNVDALFTLTLHRGDGMVLLAMNWKEGRPPVDFVGFAIEYKEPKGKKYLAVKNRLSFRDGDGDVNPNRLSSKLSPIQKFRWVHFPWNADLAGAFTYRVSPVFMDAKGELSYGEPQQAAIELRRETYPGQLNVTFTRGFVASQAFVDHFASDGDISTLMPVHAEDGLTFAPTHPKADEALAWMGFEARSAILDLLDEAIADKTAQVRVIAYDLSESHVVSKLQQLGARLKIIIDDSGDHADDGSGEHQAEERLKASAGADHVRRQHMLNLQHNKMIVVTGKVQKCVGGSTNFSWRGFYVQSNNAMILHGESVVELFMAAFESYWTQQPNQFGHTDSAQLAGLGLANIDAQIAFSPHASSNALLQTIADDIANTSSSLFYSLAFLFQTPGKIRDAIHDVTDKNGIFVYGISDRRVGGLDLQRPNGNIGPVFPAALTKNIPEPFSAEPTGGGGIRMHHKFIVIDFDKPTARVYLGSYNFSSPADLKNGENLFLIRDRRVAVSYVVEALRIFDHYHFRVIQQEAKDKLTALVLTRAPADNTTAPWWESYYTDARKIRERELFA